jgi:hypothetical protein
MPCCRRSFTEKKKQASKEGDNGKERKFDLVYDVITFNNNVCDF